MLNFPARVISILAALLLVAGALVSATDGVAWWLARGGAGMVREVSKQGELPAQEQVNAAISGTRAGLSWQPWSPDLTAQLGALNLALAIHEGSSNAAVRHAENALPRYREALRYRPSSGYFWSGLATAELVARRLDRGFEPALQRAMVFGGWDPAVRRRAIWLGMNGWAWLGDGTRGEMRTLVRRALERNEDRVIEMAVAARWVGELRPMLSDSARRRLERRVESASATDEGS